MAEAHTFTMEGLILTRFYAHPLRGDGYILQADRKGGADKWNEEGEHLAAYAIRVRPIDQNKDEYWQTIYVNMGIGA